AGGVVASRFGDDAALLEVLPWLGLVNPDASGTNCVLVAIAADMSAVPGEGLVWQAPAESPLPESDLVAYQRQLLGLADDADSLVFRTDVGSVRAVMAAAPVGSRGVVLVRSRTVDGGVGVSHAFNVLRLEGVGAGDDGVVFVDGQRGGLARVPDGVVDLLFLPVTDGIAMPAGATRVD
ncbi:hypothetical protein C7C45_33035, partial [Micromonospora arborensis]